MSGVPTTSVTNSDDSFEKFMRTQTQMIGESFYEEFKACYHAGQVQVINELRRVIENNGVYMQNFLFQDNYVKVSDILQKLSDLEEGV